MKVAHMLMLVAILFSGGLFAKEEETPDLASRFEKYRIEYHLNEDGTHYELREFASTVLKERAIEQMKNGYISYSASIQKVEILEAYTRKADGRRIAVPKNNFQVVENKGKEKDAPVYSDMVRMTVVFPELAVGDSVVLNYKITNSEAMFPDKFSVANNFSTTYAYDSVDILFDYPRTLQAHYEARGMKERVTEKKGRKRITWHFENRTPKLSKRRDYSVYDLENQPGYAFSTFAGYQEIAEAYGLRALPKATPSERVAKLADEIVADSESLRAQAKALYEWVATNITYAGNCIGVGAVVPHDLDFILDNRMGDCKDHATLLQALLAAKGIKSTQALINAGSLYQLPNIPVVSSVNHVINYLPEFDLYVDSTSSTTPFGMLPGGDIGKPVLWVENFKAGTTTPLPPPGQNRQTMKSTVTIADDGAITGSVAVALKGDFAVAMRSSLRDMPAESERDMVKNVFENQGHIASGEFTKEDASGLGDSYSYAANFQMANFINRPGAGAFAITPLFFSAAPVGRFTAAAVDQVEEVEVACSSGYSLEEYLITFPTTMKILAVPSDVSLRNDFLVYTASYKLEGQTLTVRREIDDRTPGVICSPAMQEAYKAFAAQMVNDLRAQVVYM